MQSMKHTTVVFCVLAAALILSSLAVRPGASGTAERRPVSLFASQGAYPIEMTREGFIINKRNR